MGARSSYSKLTRPPDGHPAAFYLLHTLRYLAIIVLVSTAALPCAGRQTTGVPSADQIRLEQMLGDAGARVADYVSLFKDLTAEETKTVERVRESGEASRRRQIVSDLIVYRSVLDNGSMAEYRDVRTVDGAPVEGRQERVVALFERQSRSGSVREELARVNREGSRYDLDRTVGGLTIAQGLPLQPWARSFFDFTLAGQERVGGRDTIVVAYQQAVPNPRFGFDFSLPSELKRAAPLYRGRLWLDAETHQVLREVREVAVQSVVIQRTEFEYAQSRFGIALPTRIVFSTFQRFGRNDAGPTSSLDYRITFAYGPFRRFTTSSDEGEIAGVAPDSAPAEPDATGDPVHPDAGLGPEFGEDAPVGPPPAAEPPRPSPSTAAPPETKPASPPLPPRTTSRIERAAPVELPRFTSLAPPPFPVVRIQAPPAPPAPGVKLRMPPS